MVQHGFSGYKSRLQHGGRSFLFWLARVATRRRRIEVFAAPRAWTRMRALFLTVHACAVDSHACACCCRAANKPFIVFGAMSTFFAILKSSDTIMDMLSA